MSSNLEDPHKFNDWKTTNSYQGKLIMVYNNNNESNTVSPRIYYTLNIGPHDNGNSHIIFKLSTKQILVTMKYQPIHAPEDLIKNQWKGFI